MIKKIGFIILSVTTPNSCTKSIKCYQLKRNNSQRIESYDEAAGTCENGDEYKLGNYLCLIDLNLFPSTVMARSHLEEYV